MRPAQVYANPTDEQYHELVEGLHRQWRTAARAVMAALSAAGWTAAEIAALHYDPKTVRRRRRRGSSPGSGGS